MPNESIRLSVIGLGYIGLPTAVMFASAGYSVLGVDISPNVISHLKLGEPHIEEPDLSTAFRDVCGKNLSFSCSPEPSDVYIIAVPTPVHADHTADLSYVESAVRMILPELQSNNLIIIESTIPPSTTDSLICGILSEAGWLPGINIDVVHCPERVLPGKIMHEIVYNDRIIGGITGSAAERAAQLYRSFVKGMIHCTSAINAEMTKLMENTYRDVNIALANELVKISGSLPIDPLKVIELANHHPRVQILQPGPGVGGHCIAVDPYFIIEKAFHQTPLIQAARRINNSMPHIVADSVFNLLKDIPNPTVSVFGVAYKGNVGDVRESPALEVMDLLMKRKFKLKIHDPHVTGLEGHILLSEHDALLGSDLLLVLADHKEFSQLHEAKLLKLMRRPVILDTRNCISIESDTVQYYNFGNLNTHNNKVLEEIS